jgi:predicted AlkP superfamily phosphohydrolase/phosphomutase
MYVKQKHWFYRRGVTPEWFYGLMSKWGMANHRVTRFRGKQESWIDRMGEKAFLSREHVDWSRTRAYAQGNFGQIFLNLKGRQPRGRVDPDDARALMDEIKAGLMEIVDPKTGERLVEQVHEAAELYHGPHAEKAPDLTVVLKDWKYRTIGLHDFTTHRLIAPAFGPTGDHRMEGVLIAGGPGIRPGAAPRGDANLLDVAPTVLRLLDLPVPADMDGRVLAEILAPELAAAADRREEGDDAPGAGDAPSYAEEDEAAIQARLADLGYL